MRSRHLAGCRGLVVATVVACLAVGGVFAAGPNSVVGAESNSGFGPRALDKSDQQVDRPVLYPRTNYVWPYASGPVFGESQVSADRWYKPGMLHTNVGSFDLTQGLPQLPQELTTPMQLGQLGTQYFVLVVHPDSFGEDLDAIRSAIQSNGGQIMAQMQVGGFVVRLTQAAYDAVQGHSGVMFLFPYEAAFKLSPTIGRVPLPDPQRASSDVYTLWVKPFEGEDPGLVAQAISSLGGNVTQIRSDVIVTEISRSKLADLASIQAVQSIREFVPDFAQGEETTSTMQIGGCGATKSPCQIPYNDAGIKGGGHATCAGGSNVGADCVRDSDCPSSSCSNPVAAQILMILDNGIQLDDGDLSDQKATLEVGPGSSHRKVDKYAALAGGDLLGCDDTNSNGTTHGHVVAATALGNATDVTASYIDDGSGEGWFLPDTAEPIPNLWKADGVAPRARLVAYDGQVTPSPGFGTCGSPPTITPGTLYTGPAGSCSGALCDAYVTDSARLMNFSFGGDEGVYGTEAEQVDSFLRDFPNAMVFISAGNSGGDADQNGFPDAVTVTDPATAKSDVTVGASFNTGGNVNTAAAFSSNGPATATASSRVEPLVMAPGTDVITSGITSEYSCRSNDNDQSDPVECEVNQGNAGTSFAAPAVAGTALLIRDYFGQGFYPSGERRTADREPDLSGQAVKALLIASASFMTNIAPGGGGSLTVPGRFNNEQGYGRVQIDNVLPLSSWSSSPPGLVMRDVGSGSGPANAPGLTGNIANGATQTYQFRIDDDTSELRIACAWADNEAGTPNQLLQNNIDIKLTSPSGRVYIGNFFSEDRLTPAGLETGRGNNSLDSGENCINGFDGLAPTTQLDAGAWSIPISGATSLGNPCDTAPTQDSANPNEAIFLSPDPKGNGVIDDTDTSADESVDNQLETGTWTFNVIGQSITGAGGQDYACAFAGPIVLDSSTRFNAARYVCNDLATLNITETDPAGTPSDGPLNTCAGNTACLEGEVKSRTTIKVIDSTGAVVDEEDGTDVGNGVTPMTFARQGTSYRFEAKDVLVTDGTARSVSATWNNGVLDVRDGDTLRIEYADEDGAGALRVTPYNLAEVDCQALVSFGGLVWGQFGKDSSVLVDGGCERDARGKFSFGYPDKYMDAGETIGYRVAFSSAETTAEFRDAEVTLRCVKADADSPPGCDPTLGTCADPQRLNNAACDQMTILDSPKKIGVLPAGAGVSVNFTIQMAGTITGTPEIEMIAGISATSAGKPVEGLIVSRHKLNVDEKALYYSTDFPQGGVEISDWGSYNLGGPNPGGDEIVSPSSCVSGTPCLESDRGTPTTDADFTEDYRFETWVWSNLQANGRNAAIMSPWNFDTNNGGFHSGLHNSSDDFTTDPTQWGEDKNFDGILNGDEDRNPGGPNGSLDENWSTRGGCGWQTKAAGATTGGVWHTGTIDVTTGTCTDACEVTENVGTTISTQKRSWFELLKTPEFEKVNQDLDSDGLPVWTSQHLQWAWNMTMDLESQWAYLTWELDLDTLSTVASNLDAFPVFNLITGPQGPKTEGNSPLTNGYQMFASNWVCNNNTSIICAEDANCDDLGLSGTCDVGGTDLCSSSGISCTSDDDCKCILNPAGGVSKNGSSTTSGVCKTRNDIACTGDGDCTATSSGPCITVGNRQGKNACFFEGTGNTHKPFNLAKPWDNDQNEDADGKTDEYVLPNGPTRNWDQSQANGVDMRFQTLEDVYGDSGNTFQGAVGFLIFQGTPLLAGGDPGNSWGAAVDDMVVQWKEFRLDEDATSCTPSGSTGGQCASIELENTNLYEGATVIDVTIVDPYPYDTTNPKNDCDQNGSFLDAGDDTDCNNNGTPDIVATAVESTGAAGDEEIVVLDQVAGTSTYKGSLKVSLLYDVPGVLFLQPGGGTDLPTLKVRYLDRNDGTNHVCPMYQSDSPFSGVDPAKEGLIVAATSVSVPRGTVIVEGFRIEDHQDAGCPSNDCGDGDPFPDTNETIDLYLTVNNKTTVDLDDLIVRIGTNSPNIDCIINPFVNAHSLTADPIVNTCAGTCSATGETCTATNQCTNKSKEIGPFTFKVANVNRTSVGQRFTAPFTVTMDSSRFDALLRPQTVELELDLDVTAAGSTAGSYLATFEGGGQGFGVGNFTDDGGHLDENKATLAASNGWRCQYNDPDYVNSNSYGNPDCFLGFTNTADNAYDWHRHKSGNNSPDQGRAHGNTVSLHWGMHENASNPARDTTRLKQLDAILTPPINLGWDNVNPKLQFWHQVSLEDSRGSNTPGGEAPDRAVVQLQVLDAGNTPLTNWIKISPYENIYDVQGTNAFSNCMFDPTDDGNNEDSYFDPTDPNRTLGPSSTCFPEFVYGYQGDTNYQNGFSSSATGRASDPESAEPGDTINRGTWMRTSFDLSSYRGRRVRMRFLATTIEVGNSVNLLEAGFPAGSTFEDGWYLDDVTVTDTLGTGATLDVDSSSVSYIDCPGTACDEITPVLEADPTSLSGPGQVVELDASKSTVGRCADGTLQYQFWVDVNNNGTLTLGDGDQLLRDFTDNSVLVDAPVITTHYGVVVRCSSDPSCPVAPAPPDAPQYKTVSVPCPSAVVNLAGVSPFGPPDIRAVSQTVFSWGKNVNVDVLRGDLSLVRSGQTFASTALQCVENNQVISQFTNSDVPTSGNAFYYLVRPENPYCNETVGSYGTKTAQESPNRDTEINNALCADN